MAPPTARSRLAGCASRSATVRFHAPGRRTATAPRSRPPGRAPPANPPTCRLSGRPCRCSAGIPNPDPARSPSCRRPTTCGRPRGCGGRHRTRRPGRRPRRRSSAARRIAFAAQLLRVALGVGQQHRPLAVGLGADPLRASSPSARSWLATCCAGRACGRYTDARMSLSCGRSMRLMRTSSTSTPSVAAPLLIVLRAGVRSGPVRSPETTCLQRAAG